MRMKARDSFYSSENGQVHEGQEFEVDSKERAKALEQRGLAVAVSDPSEGKVRLDDPAAAEKLSEKAKPEAPNKMAEEPANKSAKSSRRK